MNYEEFCIWVESRLKEQYEEDVHVEIQSMRKNNGVIQEGLLIIREGCNITPTIYLKEFYQMYENGMEPEMVLERLQVVYEINKAETNLDFSFFKEFNKVQDRIAYKLINREDNEVLLKEIPWVPLLDLAIVFYCILPEHILSNGTILINHGHCKDWGVNGERLYSIAKENTPKLCPPQILDMKRMLQTWERIEQDEMEDTEDGISDAIWKPVCLETLELSERREESMFILTNAMRNQGAIAILYDGILKQLSEKFGSDLYILPSSIHECIIISAEEEDARDGLEQLVYRVNHSRVAKEERLSDHVYRYGRETDEIS